MDRRVGGSDGAKPPRGGVERAARNRVIWESSVPTEEELVRLCRRFPEVVSVSEGAVRGETERWAASAVVGRSLGRRLSMEVLIRDLRRRGNLKGDLEGSYVNQGIFLLRFAEPADRDRVLLQPWVIAGQAVALEPWRPWMFPSETTVTSALVWVRLPSLPVEYWAGETLREVLCLAGEVVSVDDWTSSRRRLSFARACLRIDLGRPLRPGVLLRGPDGVRWQTFVYESIESICLDCALFHGPGCCGRGKQGVAAALSKENLAVGEVGLPEVDDGPVLGPWAMAVRRWLPSQGTGPSAATVCPVRRPGKEPVADPSGGGQLGSGEAALAPAEWQLPSKVARRALARRSEADGGGSGKGAEPVERRGMVFGGFSVLAEGMEVEKTLHGTAGERVTGRAVDRVKASPETDAGGRERPSERKKKKPLSKSQGSSKGPGSKIEVGPVPAKRARPDDCILELSKDGPTMVDRVASGSRKVGSRKGKKAISPTQDNFPGVFVFEAGRGLSIEPRDRVPDGDVRTPQELSSHAEAAKAVEEALQGCLGPDIPMDALGAVSEGQVPSVVPGRPDMEEV